MGSWLTVPYPLGDAGKLEGALGSMEAASSRLSTLESDFLRAAQTSSAGWTGSAAAIFAGKASTVEQNLAAFGRVHRPVSGILGAYQRTLAESQRRSLGARDDVERALNRYAHEGSHLARELAYAIRTEASKLHIQALVHGVEDRLLEWGVAGLAVELEPLDEPPPLPSPESILADLESGFGWGISAIVKGIEHLFSDVVRELVGAVHVAERVFAEAVHLAQAAARAAVRVAKDAALAAASDVRNLYDDLFSLRVPAHPRTVDPRAYPLSTQTLAIVGGVAVPVGAKQLADLQADGQASETVTETVNSAGQVVVEITTRGQAGVSASAADTSAGVDGYGYRTLTYVFNSPEEANNFIHGYLEVLKKDAEAAGKDGVEGMLLGGGVTGGVILAQQILNRQVETPDEYLNSFSSNYVSTVTGAGVEADVTESQVLSTVPPSMVSAGAEVAYNSTTHEVIVSSAVDATVSAQTPVASGMDSANVQAAATFDGHGQLTQLEIHGDVTAVAGASVIPLQAGATGTFDMSVDMTNPANAALAERFLADSALASSNPLMAAQAASDLASLVKASQIVVQADVTSQTYVGADFDVVSGSVSDTSSTAIATWIKPPGTDAFTEVQTATL